MRGKSARTKKKAGIVRNMTAPLLPPSRILLIRLSAFGDVVIATGLLHSLKRAHPNAEIDWLVQPEFAELLRTQPAIANVMVWPRKDWRALFRGGHWLALWRAIRQFSATLRARNYDWVIDAQGLFKSRVMAKLAGGQRRIGYISKEPGAGWMDQLVPRFPERHPQRRFIGAEHAPMLQALTSQQEAIPKLEWPAVPSPTPYLVASPFTTRPEKHWPEAHWVALLKNLANRGHRVLMLGGPADREKAERMISAIAMPQIENRAGQTTFTEAAQLIAGATLLIGVDTGLTHVGFALSRPTLALFGATVPYHAARDHHSRVLVAPCDPDAGSAAILQCLQQITPTQVLAAAEELLGVQAVAQ